MSRMLRYFPQSFQWLSLPPGSSTQHECDMERLHQRLRFIRRTSGQRDRGEQGRRVWRRAQQCLEMARTFGDRNARVTLAHMAQAWLRLADNCQDAKKVRPAMRQQQQIQPKDDDKKK